MKEMMRTWLAALKNIFLLQVDRDTKHLVLWVHRPQNKNWTLSPALVTIVNDSRSSLERMF